MDSGDNDEAWQMTKHNLLERSQHLLATKKWYDCQFSVGNPPNTQVSINPSILVLMSQ